MYIILQKLYRLEIYREISILHDIWADVWQPWSGSRESHSWASSLVFQPSGRWKGKFNSWFYIGFQKRVQGWQPTQRFSFCFLNSRASEHNKKSFLKAKQPTAIAALAFPICATAKNGIFKSKAIFHSISKPTTTTTIFGQIWKIVAWLLCCSGMKLICGVVVT